MKVELYDELGENLLDMVSKNLVSELMKLKMEDST